MRKTNIKNHCEYCADCEFWEPRDFWKSTNRKDLNRKGFLVEAQGDCSNPTVAGKFETTPKMNYMKACSHAVYANRGVITIIDYVGI